MKLIKDMTREELELNFKKILGGGIAENVLKNELNFEINNNSTFVGGGAFKDRF